MKIALLEDVFMSDVGNERVGCIIAWSFGFMALGGVLVDAYGSIDND